MICCILSGSGPFNKRLAYVVLLLLGIKVWNYYMNTLFFFVEKQNRKVFFFILSERQTQGAGAEHLLIHIKLFCCCSSVWFD